MTLQTVDPQAPRSMGLSRQKYWSGLPCPPPGYLLEPGIEPASLLSPALASGFFTTSTTWKALGHTLYLININNSSMALSYFLSISNSDQNLFSLTHLVPQFQQFFDPWTYLPTINHATFSWPSVPRFPHDIHP